MMTAERRRPRSTAPPLLAFALAALALLVAGAAPAAARPATLEMFAPEQGDRAGLHGRGWFVDLEAEFDDVPLLRTGYNEDPSNPAVTDRCSEDADGQGPCNGLQLTGPIVHENQPPFPGLFGNARRDDRFRSLIVLVSTNAAGPGANVADLFNLTGVTNRTAEETELWATWIVGGRNFGTGRSTVHAAIAADRDGNGSFDDAPATVPDADGDGDVDSADLRAFGVASNVERATFFINP